LPGIADTARFFLATSEEEAGEILRQRRVRWVVVAESDRLLENSAAILARAASPDALGRSLDRTPSRAPAFLSLIGQNGTCKIYQSSLSR